MNEKRLYNICKEILTHIERKDEISEDQVYRLGEGLSFYYGEEKMPATYIKLLDTLGQKWRYQQMDDLSPEQLFVYGGLWGCIQAMEMKRMRIQTEELKREKWNVLIKGYDDKKQLLEVIQKNPGIRHKELAESVHKSPSQLSQIMVRMTGDGIVSCNYAGREKFYFLTELGEKLTDKLIGQWKKNKVNGLKYQNNEDTNSVYTDISDVWKGHYEGETHVWKRLYFDDLRNVENSFVQEREEGELICLEKEPILKNA